MSFLQSFKRQLSFVMAASSRSECLFGTKCYRKNPIHFTEFEHRHVENLAKKVITKQVANISDLNVNSDLADQVQCVLSLLNSGKISIAGDLAKVTLEDGQIATEIPVGARPQPNTSISNSASEAEVPPPAKKTRRDEENESEKAAYLKSLASTSQLTILEKVERSAPFHFFLSSIADIAATDEELLTVKFSDILDPLLGKLSESLQLNYMAEVGWLLAQYCRFGLQRKPLLLLHGEDTAELRDISRSVPSIKTVRVKPKYPFGHHHTKMCVISYEDGSLRVVVHTGNLIESDWLNRTQGVWISPACPQLKNPSSNGESPTFFKRDLLRYFNAYQLRELKPWLEKIEACDFSHINVCLIPSIPGSYEGSEIKRWGLGYLKSLLQTHVSIAKDDTSFWTPIIQCSSIGSLGPTPNDWFLNEMGTALYASSTPALRERRDLKLVFPSFKNVAKSLNGVLGGGCLPYAKKQHVKQPWLRNYLYQWKTEHRLRTRAVPHIKTYTRVSGDGERALWFVLSSANLSKAAWGMMSKKGNCTIQAYEVGVLFLPKFIFGTDHWHFRLNNGDLPNYSLPYPIDLPLTKYEEDDEPWFIDYLR